MDDSTNDRLVRRRRSREGDDEQQKPRKFYSCGRMRASESRSGLMAFEIVLNTQQLAELIGGAAPRRLCLLAMPDRNSDDGSFNVLLHANERAAILDNGGDDRGNK